MEEVIIRQVPIGSFEVFTYIAACPESRLAAIIDPAGDPEKIVSLLSEENLQAAFILNTHGHADHILANNRLKEVLGVPLCMHKADVDFFSDPDTRDKTAKELGITCETAVDVLLEDGHVLHMGSRQIQVIHTPASCSPFPATRLSGRVMTMEKVLSRPLPGRWKKIFILRTLYLTPD
ncbi:MAG: MBL fold metallo-hydrolase [Deltaproteobacteria bacterium]|nr:MBL fold metallo-hydrolase [Deltaproteobacteria bacterium]